VSRLVSIIGHKNAGKTTLVAALARELKRQRRTVGTIKHSTHPVDVDREGTDSWRHFHEGLADGVVVASPELRVAFERRRDETGPEELAQRYFADMDVVLVEGFKGAPIPKIEIWRREIAKAPLFNAQAPNAGDWIAILCDDHRFTAPCRVLHFTDTMWLNVLTALILDRGKTPVSPQP
jgi:molybdopterin-guanine dinucleotide biosynthesis adapter protein